jgi:phospholipid/cholesterol/gamma-HCH transport system substrate-binding protein
MKRATFLTKEQLRVGGIIVVSMVLIAVGLYKLGQAANLFSRRYELIAFLPEAAGLREGGSVMVAGQLAGTVKKIDFLPVDNDTTRNLRLTLTLDERLSEQVRRDSRARIRTLGLLGDKVVDIAPGTPRTQPLRKGDTISIAPSLDYEAVITQAAGAVDDVIGLVTDFRVITTGLVKGQGTVGQLLTNPAMYQNINGTLERTNMLLARVTSSRGTVARLLDDPTFYNRMLSVVSNADSMVIALNSRSGTVGRLLHNDSLAINLETTTTKLVSIMTAADSLMRMMQNGQGTIGRALVDQTLYDAVNKLVHDIAAMLADIRKDPQRWLRGVIKVF